MRHAAASRRSRPADGGDADLLSRCRAGDDAAWDQLVGKYERLVFSVALRNGLDREDAADVTQTTFIALLDSTDQDRAHQQVQTRRTRPASTPPLAYRS
jgi:Sigma-70 region 2